MRRILNNFSTTIAMFVLAIPNGVSAQMNSAEAHAGPAMNYHRVDDRLATGGHFVDGGLADLHGQGVKVVIDLRDKPPSGQKEKLAKLGIEWINIPVVWKAPKQRDFDRFSRAMSKHQDDNVLVQCQANYRASAMTYLYRVVVEKVPEKDAKEDLRAVWEPNDLWQDYMNGIIETAP